MNTDFINLGNNILLQSFNLAKPVHCRYVPTDKNNIIAFIRIGIRRMWISTNFVTSLPG